MFDYKLVENNLNQALLFLSEVLSETQIDFIRSYIDSGEWRLALETLCEILSEDELPISTKVYELLQEIGTYLGLEETTLEMLTLE
jgi:hypothetical protein